MCVCVCVREREQRHRGGEQEEDDDEGTIQKGPIPTRPFVTAYNLNY